MLSRSLPSALYILEPTQQQEIHCACAYLHENIFSAFVGVGLGYTMTMLYRTRMLGTRSTVAAIDFGLRAKLFYFSKDEAYVWIICLYLWLRPRLISGVAPIFSVWTLLGVSVWVGVPAKA